MYQDLVDQLLEEMSGSYNVVLVIDALNECDPPKDVERLCKFLRGLVQKHPHFWVLFSSHEHMNGVAEFQDGLEVVKVVQDGPVDGITKLVKAELSHRCKMLSQSGSLFCE